MHAKPILLAIWLAEEVVDDAQTGRLTAHGLFNQIAIAPDAVQYEVPFTVFFSVSDVRSRCRCVLRLLDLSSLDDVYLRDVILEPVSAAEVLDIFIRVSQLPIPHPGSYAWELLMGDDVLGATRMIVTAFG